MNIYLSKKNAVRDKNSHLTQLKSHKSNINQYNNNKNIKQKTLYHK